jgi:CheY-like chemotaxis protein
MQHEHSTPSVMVVDDDQAIREVMEELFADEGYDVVTAANGEEALRVLRTVTKHPGVILLDLNMPIMTGWEFRNVQKLDPKIASIPVVVFSADRGLLNSASQLDAAAYLAKPLDIMTLLDTVESCVSRGGTPPLSP